MSSLKTSLILAAAASMLSFGVAMAQTDTPAAPAAPAAGAAPMATPPDGGAASDPADAKPMKKHMAKKHTAMKKHMAKKKAM